MLPVPGSPSLMQEWVATQSKRSSPFAQRMQLVMRGSQPGWA